MGKIKTLKDFETDSCSIDSFRVADCDELKQEGIKFINKIKSGEEVSTGTMMFKWDERSPYTGAAGAVLIDFIKHFFNIVEEDLE